MNLKWGKSEVGKDWHLRSVAPGYVGNVMAIVTPIDRGHYQIAHWVTEDGPEDPVMVEFKGNVQHAKTYALALVRMS